MLKGKGIYIWKIKECEDGNIKNIVTMCQNANFSHVIIKIADGITGFNYTTEDGDVAKALADALKVVGIEPWGFQYIYGNDPVQEAKTANRRMDETGVVGFVINAEHQIRDIANNDLVVESYFANIDDLGAIALSSYRYPEVHPKFPWKTFAKFLNNENDFMMPQVYWMQAHDPAVQLRECLRQYAKITDLPILPTGSAFCEWGWCPTNEEIEEFASEALGLGLPGINFWEWSATRRGGFWKTVRDIDYSLEEVDCCEELKRTVAFWFTETDGEVEKNTNEIEILRLANNRAWEVIPRMDTRIEDRRQDIEINANKIELNGIDLDGQAGEIETLHGYNSGKTTWIQSIVDVGEYRHKEIQTNATDIDTFKDDFEMIYKDIEDLRAGTAGLTSDLGILRAREIAHTREHNAVFDTINSTIEKINSNIGGLQEDVDDITIQCNHLHPKWMVKIGLVKENK